MDTLKFTLALLGCVLATVAAAAYDWRAGLFVAGVALATIGLLLEEGGDR